MRPLVPLAFCWLLLLLLSDHFQFFPFAKHSGLAQMPDEKMVSHLSLLEYPQKINDLYKVTATLSFPKDQSVEALEGIHVVLKYPSELVDESGITFQKGDRLRCFLKWKLPTRYKNPGITDARKVLERQKIYFVSTMTDVNDCVVEEKGGVSFLSRFVFEMQNHLREKIEQSLSQTHSNAASRFIKALVLGDRSDFQKEDWDVFQKTGTTHLIAVSGLHLAIVGGVFYAIILFLLKRSEKFLLFYSAKSWALILTLIPMALFVLLTGNAVSAWRAWVMLGVISMAFVLRKDHDSWSSIALAFLVLTILYPAFLFSISFQLSVLAVIGLVLSRRWSFYRKKKTKINFFTLALIVSLSVFGMTVACVILHFHVLSFSGLIHNLWAIPATNALLILSLLVLSLSFIVPISFGWKLLEVLSLWFLKALKLASLWALQVSFYPDSMEALVLIGVSLCVVIFLSWSEWRRESVVISLGLLLVWGVHMYRLQNCYEVCFIDVGQGDAALIQAPGHKAMMVDTGGFLIPSYKKNQSFDVGENILVPYLKTKGVEHIDRLILSHPHPDHFGGAVGLLKNIKTDELCTNGQSFPDESYDILMKTQQDQGIPVCTLKKGDVWAWQGLTWNVVYPEKINTANNINDNSLVMRLSGNGPSFLFTGDIEGVGEGMLSDQEGFVSDVMKVPHHGSKTSSSVAFIDTVKPKYAVASLGENNFFGFPHADILERYQRRDARVFRTDQDGEVCFSWQAASHTTSSPNSPNSKLSIQTFFSDR